MATTQHPRRLVGTSLKLYFDLEATLSYTKSLASLAPLASKSNIDLFIIPDFVSITSCAEILRTTAPTVRLGAQDTFHTARGAFTGEVSPLTLSQAGVKIVEVGHAERRALFGETDADVVKKSAACIQHGMVPLICIGEKAKPGPSASAAVGNALGECRQQLKGVLDSIPVDAEIVIAYEPVWAIGASEPAGADHVVAVTKEIRRYIVEEKGRSGATVRILYGGSAGPGTFQRLKESVDGLFLGRFAHDVKNLEKVIEEMSGP